MTSYNRVRGIAWPISFAVSDGHRFTVVPPERGPDGPLLRCRVEGGPGAGDYEIGAYLNEQTAGGLIGRTIRWWIERTGVGVSIDPGRRPVTAACRVGHTEALTARTARGLRADAAGV